MFTKKILHLATIISLFGASTLQAHTTFGSWDNNNVVLRISNTSFPAGNAYRSALSTVRNRFYYGQPSALNLNLVFGDTSVGFDNGQSEVWASSSSMYNPAVTFAWMDGSCIVESDIVFCSQQPWTSSTSKTLIWSYGGIARPFQTTAIHEFGHAVGLDHEDGEYNSMGQDWTHITCNGSTYRSYVGEDAANGLVSLYGLYQHDIEDLSVSSFRRTGQSGGYSVHGPCIITTTSGATAPFEIDDQGQRRYLLNRGQSYRVQFTFENNGASTHHNVGLEYHISNNNYISFWDPMIRSTKLPTLGRDNVYTRFHKVTIPSNLTPLQTYCLGVRIDAPSAVIESTEFNNAAYHMIRIIN